MEEIRDLDSKIAGISGLLTTVVLNNKISKAENKIPDTSGLATTDVLNIKIGEVGNKIPDVSKLLKKTDCNTVIKDTNRKYFTTADYNKFTSNILDTDIKQKQLVSESNISDLINNSLLSANLAILATKVPLKAKQDKIVKLQMHIFK